MNEFSIIIPYHSIKFGKYGVTKSTKPYNKFNGEVVSLGMVIERRIQVANIGFINKVIKCNCILFVFCVHLSKCEI